MRKTGVSNSLDIDFECHFIGEIDFGSRFAMDDTEGYFVECCVITGSDWDPLCKMANSVLQTQTSYPDEYGVVAWSHPIDYYFKAKSIDGWPRLRLVVWHLNSEGVLYAHSYGTVSLPNAPGHHELKCSTWCIKGTQMEELHSRMLGQNPELLQAHVIDSGAYLRRGIQTKTGGNVHISLDVIFRNAFEQDIKIVSQCEAN